MYLRKSRADAEAEARGEGETLARHEHALLELARRQHLNVTDIYREIVSGDTIAARPMMQRVLSEVEQGAWDGVLVMEVERLARGDTIDQGIVAQTFKFSGTKIVTPMKTYDPSNEFDEEYFEFGLFMSRREYKTINRRLQRGRMASVREGKYVANSPPYGYRRVRLEHDKGFTLEPIPEQAEIIRLIYKWYTSGIPDSTGASVRIGVSRIVRKLNETHVLAQRGGDWSVASVRDILINPVYIGMVRWNWRSSVKRMENGEIHSSRPRAKAGDWLLAKGLHPAIVGKDVFDAAQEIISRNHAAPVPANRSVANPLAGLIFCGKCGRRMVRRPYGNGYPDTLMCQATSCNNVSSSLELVEKRVLTALREWVKNYKSADRVSTVNPIPVVLDTIRVTDKELATLSRQLDRVHELLEQGVYSVDEFLDRSKRISSEIESTQHRKSALENETKAIATREENRRNLIPKAEYVLEVYDYLKTAREKNDLLKEVIEKVVYIKEHGGRWHSDPGDFEITLLPKLPAYH
ncbi:MAG: recombinase family protein [Ethanoligenens sp.]